MQLKTRALGALAGLVVLVGVNGTSVGAERAYTEGAVVQVGSIRTEPGMFDEYMKYLAGPYKQWMEEQKKAGVILDYAVYQATPRGPMRFRRKSSAVWSNRTRRARRAARCALRSVAS